MRWMILISLGRGSSLKYKTMRVLLEVVGLQVIMLRHQYCTISWSRCIQYCYINLLYASRSQRTMHPRESKHSSSSKAPATGYTP